MNNIEGDLRRMHPPAKQRGTEFVSAQITDSTTMNRGRIEFFRKQGPRATCSERA